MCMWDPLRFLALMHDVVDIDQFSRRSFVEQPVSQFSPECRFCEEEDETFPHILNGI